MSTKIKNIHAREILDSRGNPTVEAEVQLIGGVRERAAVPSGASTGSYETLELRDNDPKRYDGKGVLKVCRNIDEKISKVLKGCNVTQQKKIDQIMIELDGTENKSFLGGNAILAVSLACARAAAKEKKLPLYKYISEKFKIPARNGSAVGDAGGQNSEFRIPIPMFNIFNGGKHADNNLDFQEFMIIPQNGKILFKQKVQIGAEIFHSLKKVLLSKNLDTDVANEGGFAPDVETNNQAFEMILEAVKKAGYEAEKDVKFALDAGATTFYDKKENQYILKGEGVSLSPERLISLYVEWAGKYPMFSIEDGLYEDDWKGWKRLNNKLKVINNKLLIVGDDLTVTNIKRIKRAISQNCANAVIIKPNQIGTLTETIEAIKIAKEADWKIIISHRSGETCDAFISDLAVGVGADYIKAGSLSRSERTAKYNRLMEIEEEII